MDDTRRLLRHAAFRLSVHRFLSACVALTAIALAALTALRIADRLLAFDPSWQVGWIVSAGLVLLGAFVWTIIHWPRAMQVAMLVDDRARLRETLSTAHAVAHIADPWAQLVVQDARVLARRVLARQATPIGTPRGWPSPIVALVVFAGVWFFLPQFDLLGVIAKADAAQEHRRAIEEAHTQVDAVEKDLAKELAKLRDAGLTDDLDLSAIDKRDKPATPDDIRRSAIRKLSTLREQIDSMRSGVKGKTLDNVRNKLANIRAPGPGPLDAFAKALQKGEIKQASAALSQLIKKVAQGELSSEQRQQLAAQLKRFSEQLGKTAAQQRALANALAKAGLDPKLAANPQAAMRAIANAADLTQEQRDTLMQHAQAAKNAQQAMQAMAQAMQQAAQSTRNGAGMNMQGLTSMANSLSEMEMLNAELAQAQAASFSLWNKINELGAQSSSKSGQANMLQQWQKIAKGGNGVGSGGGFGEDMANPIDPGAYTATKTQAKSKIRPGPIIGSRLVQGDQIRGEARAAFVEAVKASSQAAADAIESHRVPLEHQDAVKHYFGRLQEKIRAGTPSAKPAQPGPEPSKNDDAKDKR